MTGLSSALKTRSVVPLSTDIESSQLHSALRLGVAGRTEKVTRTNQPSPYTVHMSADRLPNWSTLKSRHTQIDHFISEVEGHGAVKWSCLTYYLRTTNHHVNQARCHTSWQRDPGLVAAAATPEGTLFFSPLKLFAFR